MNPIGLIHDTAIHARRITVLAGHLEALLPRNASVLDVGCGDGLLAKRILQSRSEIDIQGLDTLVRPRTPIPVLKFDGAHLPYEERSVDVVSFVDVLHHTDDPMELLREAKRVARKYVVIKDHTRQGLLAGSTLRFMDWVGNAHHGVALPYNYWSLKQWQAAFAGLELTVDRWSTKLGLYPGPADWLFGRSLHFITRLRV